MKRLRIPTLQHLARNWRDTPEKVEKVYVALAKNTPTFSYQILNDLVRDFLVYRIPEEQIAEGITRKEKREKVRKILLEILPLLCSHFGSIYPDYVHSIAPRHYPLGKGLMVPFKPPLLYGVGGQVYFPWFSFWRSNPLNNEQLSLFVTLAEEMLLQDPDLDTSKFQILDFSASSSKESRELQVINASDIPKLNSFRKKEMLMTFVDGFERAQNALLKSEDVEESINIQDYDENQLQLLE